MAGRLKCPQCTHVFTPPEGVAPICPNCSYAPGGPVQAATPQSPTAQPSYQPPGFSGGGQYGSATTYASRGDQYSGPPTQANYGAHRAANNGMATASMVLGIIGLCVWFLGIVALILGIVAKRQIKERNEGGDGMATAGIVMGSIAIAFMVLYLIGVLFALTTFPTPP